MKTAGVEKKMIKVALVGARGYVGFELLKLLDSHPNTEVVAAFSREFDGKLVSDVVTGFSNKYLSYISDEFESLLDKQLDVIFLALPNGLATEYRLLWDDLSSKVCIIDLSSDFRFDKEWIYGQPETSDYKPTKNKLIANPGCYATAAQLTVLPVLNLLKNAPHIFGVSGYSGAGSKPCKNNNLVNLENNLVAYQLTDHIHEREICHVVGQPVNFIPHVAAYFRGIHLTVSIEIKQPMTVYEIKNLYNNYYKKHELITITDEIPEVKQVQNTHNVVIGGFSLNDNHLVVCTVIDNLLKGAATQAIQNLNLAFNLNINTGILTNNIQTERL
jgi:N-acetyl-gamma-glutamyl-phosphate reductase common form